MHSHQNGSCVFLAVLVLAFFGNHVGILFAQDAQQTIKSLEIEGNARIEESAIRGRMTLKPGDPYTEEAIRKEIRTIFQMGYFEDVQVKTEPLGGNQVSVVFMVTEKPFITEIVFDGNDNLSDDKLREAVTVRSQTFLNKREVKESAEGIRKAYQEAGYHQAQIVPVIQAIEEDLRRLTFFIQEGERARIKTVTFKGRAALEKDELLEVTANREWEPIISLITDAGILRREELPNDVERIREVYMNKGYLDVQIGAPTIDLTEDKKWFTLTFSIEEGQPYTVEVVTFEGNTVFTDDELRFGSLILEGEIARRIALREEITRITDIYGEKGYAFTEVTPRLIPNREAHTAEIKLRIKEGHLTKVRQIYISGNDKTRDNVIRRELRINEQEVIDTRAMKRSFERLNNLNFFETVEIIPKQVADDQVDLHVQVKEKPTGSFSVGGGFSTLDQFVAIANITEGNLFGRGYMVRVRGQLGGRRTIGIVSFRNPALFDTLTSFQADGFSTRTNYLTFVQSRKGGTVTFGRAFSEYIGGSLTLVGEELNITSPASDAPQFILDQLGHQSTTGIRTSIFRDTRDFRLSPSSGYRTSFEADFGTQLLGGTNNFYKFALDGIKYTSLFWNLRHSIRARIGVAEGFGGRPLPLAERFYVGGINTVRGFKFGRAGPVTSGGTLEGAKKQLIFNNDFIFPVSKEAKLNGVLFFDYGKGFADDESLSFDLRPAAGVEVRWLSPFGPLRVAYGLNLDPRPNESKGAFAFAVGQIF